MKLKSRTYRRAIAFALGLVVFIIASIICTPIASYSQLPPTNVASIRPDTAAELAYKQLPEFPLENQYVSRETGEVSTQYTSIERIIRYHQYVKNRPLNYRIDWKLTLADYLGVNEAIQPDRYPGNSTLTQNPLEGDRAIVSNLSREQRNKLVETLLSIYNPQENTTTSSPAKPPSENSSDKPKFPQRGNADLLLP